MSVSDTKHVPGGDQFRIDVDNSSGLSLRVRGGVYVHASAGFKSAANATVTLTASTTNYIELSDAGAISGNATGFTAGTTQLYIVTTGASEITGVADCRSNSASTQAVDGVQATNLADVNVVGALPVLHRIDLAAGALAETDVVLTHKTRVIDAWLVLRGAGVATTTVKVQNGATTITDAMAASGSDKAVVRAATLDDAQWDIAAGGTLRIKTETGATQPACTVFVLGARVA